MKKKEDLLTSRLQDYTRNNAAYRNSCGNRTALLFTASAAAGLGAMICPPPAESAVQYSGLQNLAMGTTQSPPKLQILDLDGDGVDDFAFAFLRYNISYSYFYGRAKMEYNVFQFMGAPGNNIIADFNATSSFAARLPGNYNIQQTLPGSAPTRQWIQAEHYLAAKIHYSASWYSVTNSTTATTNISDSLGNFVGKRGYLGISFQISGHLHYGWIQFVADEDMKNGRIIDWAYEDTPDTSIRAGEGRFNWNMFMPAIIQGGQNKP